MSFYVDLLWSGDVVTNFLKLIMLTQARFQDNKSSQEKKSCMRETLNLSTDGDSVMMYFGRALSQRELFQPLNKLFLAFSTLSLASKELSIVLNMPSIALIELTITITKLSLG